MWCLCLTWTLTCLLLAFYLLLLIGSFKVKLVKFCLLSFENRTKCFYMLEWYYSRVEIRLFFTSCCWRRKHKKNIVQKWEYDTSSACFTLYNLIGDFGLKKDKGKTHLYKQNLYFGMNFISFNALLFYIIQWLLFYIIQWLLFHIIQCAVILYYSMRCYIKYTYYLIMCFPSFAFGENHMHLITLQ